MSNNIIIFRTISYLNQITGKNYNQTSFANNTDMCNLIEQGYDYQDFKRVIDNKWKQWKGTAYEQYVRPSTLFGNKFEPTNEHFEDFATDLGWRYRGRYLSNNQLKYSLDAPKGYLPRAFLDGPVWGNFIAYFDGCKIK